MSAQPPSVRAIFDHALDFPSEPERQAYLDSACEGVLDRREKVEALLRAYSSAGSFLEDPPAAVASGRNEAVRPISEGPGTRIGPYKLLQQIGEGGFGVVYMAEQQTPVRRKIALKIIKPGMDTKEVIARFESERQALAMMDHPNIAKVLDAGATESGRPYFVMELVKGIPITQFCDDNHLPPEERLELFIQVCNALQHAHQKGIIHRDLKPSNVMVTMRDGHPVPKVIDFGVAKATSQTLTERTLFTAYGQMIGTPAYMSPEQAEMSCLDIDTRSDIYSLGVLLYELLTGSTPFEAKRLRDAGFSEMQRIIREEEPESVSTRIAKIRRVGSAHQSSSRQTPSAVSASLAPSPQRPAPRVSELDWIVMRSLEKDREQRYESAISLARDIRRYLSDEPVQACPPTALYRFRKYAKKHRASLITVSVVLAMLIAAAAVSTWQAINANQSRQLADERLLLANDRLASERQARQEAEQSRRGAEVARERAQSEQNRAEANFEKALDAVDKMLARVGDQAVNDVSGMDEVQTALLQDAVKYYEEFLAERPVDPKLRFKAAKLYFRISVVYWLSGEIRKRHEAVNVAYELLQALHHERPDDPEIAVELGNLMISHSYTDGEPSKSEETNRNAIKLLTRLVDHPLEDIARTAKVNLSRAYNHLGDALVAQTRYEEAESVYKAQIKWSQSADHLFHEGVGNRQLGQMFKITGRREEAVNAFRQAVVTWRKAVEKSPTTIFRWNLATDCLSLGYALVRTSRWDDALPHFREAHAISERLFVDFPMRPNNRDLYMRSCNALAEASMHFERLDDAEAAYRAVIAAAGDKPDPVVPTFKAYHQLAAILKKKERLPQATQALREAIRLEQASLNTNRKSPAFRAWFANSSFDLAEILLADGQTKEGLAHLEEAIVTLRTLATEFPDNTHYQDRLAALLKLQAQHFGQEKLRSETTDK